MILKFVKVLYEEEKQKSEEKPIELELILEKKDEYCNQ